MVKDFEIDPRKKSIMTGVESQFPREVTNAASHKQTQMATSQPQTFGNSGYYQVRY
jgi:hypothetical protein